MDDKEYLKTLGLNIKIARTIKGVSQDDIAGDLGIDKSYLSKVECGIANPSILYLKSISQYFNIDLKKLVDSEFIPKN